MTSLQTIKVGEEAPDFELPSSELADNGKPGRKIRLRDHRGQNVVLAFFPLAFSPVCTGENACFQANFVPELAGLGAQLFGISVDSAWAMAAFKRDLGLTYPLLGDFYPHGAVAKRYGLFLEESGFSARATVIVDRRGKVAFVKVQQIPDPRDNREIMDFLKKLD